LTRIHKFLCAIVAVLTFIFAIAYFSVGYMPQVAQAAIDQWQINLDSNEAFAATAFDTAYAALRELHPVEMSKVPAPADNNNTLELPTEACRKDAATSFAAQATHNFRTLHPFLSAIATPIIPREAVEKDAEKFWTEHPNVPYPVTNAVKVAAIEIWSGLKSKLPGTAYKMRMILVLLFLLSQLVPFSLISYGAYVDLKVTV